MEVKSVVLQLATLLGEYNVTDIVVSPGSRNAALTVAFYRKGYRLHYVVDERQAAFVALGISVTTDHPVACVCTSGSAVLNYGPAAAEAEYSNIPLLLISADRPYYAIDNHSPQTIRQAGVLGNIVRKSIDLRDGEDERYTNRMLNGALARLSDHRPGPVHINVQLDYPLLPDSFDMPVYAMDLRCGQPGCWSYPLLYEPGKKYLIVIGGLNPDDNIDVCREYLAELPANVAVIAEVQSNLSDYSTIPAADFYNNLDDVPLPDAVIIAGTPSVDSRMGFWLEDIEAFKLYLNASGSDYDGYKTELSLPLFLASFSSNGFFGRKSNYCKKIQSFKPSPASPVSELIDRLSGMDIFLHLSNGMTIREAQKVKIEPKTKVWCNRGVSGIEGSLSTAIGASIVSPKPVVLITGDMSAAYDIGALSIKEVSASFTMIVVSNGGGEIFRVVPTTRDLPERDTYFTPLPKFPIRQLAEAYGYDFQSVTNQAEIELSDGVKPKIVELQIQ